MQCLLCALIRLSCFYRCLKKKYLFNGLKKKPLCVRSGELERKMWLFFFYLLSLLLFVKDGPSRSTTGKHWHVSHIDRTLQQALLSGLASSGMLTSSQLHRVTWGRITYSKFFHTSSKRKSLNEKSVTQRALSHLLGRKGFRCPVEMENVFLDIRPHLQQQHNFEWSDTIKWCMVVWCAQNLRLDGNSFTWHQPCNNQ